MKLYALTSSLFRFFFFNIGSKNEQIPRLLPLLFVFFMVDNRSDGAQ